MDKWRVQTDGSTSILVGDLEGRIRVASDGTYSAWVDQVTDGVHFPSWDSVGYTTLRAAKLACRSALAWDARKRRAGTPRPVGLLRGAGQLGT